MTSTFLTTSGSRQSGVLGVQTKSGFQIESGLDQGRLHQAAFSFLFFLLFLVFAMFYYKLCVSYALGSFVRSEGKAAQPTARGLLPIYATHGDNFHGSSQLHSDETQTSVGRKGRSPRN